ncbi:MAG: class I SAM-dependent methyltransferase [Patescibacteria group bacterium]
MKNQALYAKYADGRHWDNHPTIYAERFIEILRARSFSGRLIDAGCGSGRDMAAFTANGFDVSGLDNSRDEVEAAASAHPECHFMLSDIENLPFGNNSIGAYFVINVIHYVDQARALSEIERTLVPGGLLFVHFNLQITDASGRVDYKQEPEQTRQLVKSWRIYQRIRFNRVDIRPTYHTHEILELVLEKPDTGGL